MQTVDFRHFPLAKGDWVLDLGCGEGRHALAACFAQEVTAVGVDIALDNLRAAQKKFDEFSEDGPGNHPPPTQLRTASLFHRLPCRSRIGVNGGGAIVRTDRVAPERGDCAFAAATALRLPFTDGSFDKIICSEVLEHIPDYRAALGEIARVLKPGGLFCASVPRRWPERLCWAFSKEYRNTPGGHIRIFNSAQLSREIEALGLARYRRHGAHALHAPFWWLKCLFWQSQDTNPLIRLYHKFLVWDLLRRPRLTRYLERALNPVLGKSVVLYFRKSFA